VECWMDRSHPIHLPRRSPTILLPLRGCPLHPRRASHWAPHRQYPPQDSRKLFSDRPIALHRAALEALRLSFNEMRSNESPTLDSGDSLREWLRFRHMPDHFRVSGNHNLTVRRANPCLLFSLQPCRPLWPSASTDFDNWAEITTPPPIGVGAAFLRCLGCRGWLRFSG
jgi:hypothetical protein